jgi:DDE superfamily endonuclease
MRDAVAAMRQEFGSELWKIAVSPTGWSDAQHAQEWLGNIYHPFTEKRKGKYRLLILDGHKSHSTLEFMSFCADHDIVLLYLPPHTSHLLQPLDVGCFGPLQRGYNTCLQARCATGVVRIQSAEAIEIYVKCRREALTRKYIQLGFSRTGIFPHQPSVLEHHFHKPKFDMRSTGPYSLPLPLHDNIFTTSQNVEAV